MQRNRTVTLILSAGAAISVLGGTPPAAAEPCGVNLGSETIQTALNVQPEAIPGIPWGRDPLAVAGNFDQCATLSVAIASVQGATGSSPDVALLFNHGIYVGPATPTPRGFTSLNRALTTDDTLALDYKTPGSCNACSDGTISTVRYQWQSRGPGQLGHEVRLDQLPAQ